MLLSVCVFMTTRVICYEDDMVQQARIKCYIFKY
jgi:hypothetical protein